MIVCHPLIVVSIGISDEVRDVADRRASLVDDSNLLVVALID